MENTGEDPKTPPIEAVSTEGNDPSAPNLQAKAGESEDEVVSISKKELESLKKSQKDLLSQRDRNVERVNQSEHFVSQLMQERYIDSFLAESKTKFPDVTRDDLMYVADPDDLEAEATKLQNKITQAVQKRIQEIENPVITPMSPEDKAVKIAELKEQKGVSGKFQKFISILQS